jgi:hypothetical protein
LVPPVQVILKSSLESNDCYITTANLDGESALKVRPRPRLASISAIEDSADAEAIDRKSVV